MKPKQNEAEHFARELAQKLERGRNAKLFEHLVLVAPVAFIGLINEKHDAQTAKLVIHRHEKGYTRINDQELAEHLDIFKKNTIIWIELEHAIPTVTIHDQ